MNQSKKSNVIMPPSGTFTVDFTYLYKVKFFDIYKLFVKLTVTVKNSNGIKSYFIIYILFLSLYILIEAYIYIYINRNYKNKFTIIKK